jgi:hypothetical protein
VDRTNSRCMKMNIFKLLKNYLMRLSLCLASAAGLVSFCYAQSVANTREETQSKNAEIYTPPAVAAFTPKQWVERIIRYIEEPLPTPEAFAAEMGVEWEKKIEVRDWYSKELGSTMFSANIPWDYPILEREKKNIHNIYKGIGYEFSKNSISLSFRISTDFFYFCVKEKAILNYLQDSDFSLKAKPIIKGHVAPPIIYERDNINFSYGIAGSCVKSISIVKFK